MMRPRSARRIVETAEAAYGIRADHWGEGSVISATDPVFWGGIRQTRTSLPYLIATPIDLTLGGIGFTSRTVRIEDLERNDRLARLQNVSRADQIQRP